MPGLWEKILGVFHKSNAEPQQQQEEILNFNDETKIIISLIAPITSKMRRVGYESLTETEKIFYCVYWLEGEINNGGFHQYFSNSAGDHAIETVSALKKIGAGYTAEILEQSLTVFPEKAPFSDREKRQEQLFAIGEENEKLLNELDDKFYAYTDPIGSLLVKYLKDHKDDIQLPG